MKKTAYQVPSTVKTSDALFSIWSALDADPQQLAARLRSGEASKAEMSLAADLIEKKIKPRRPRSSREQRLEIAKRFAQFKKGFPTWQRKRLVDYVVQCLKDRGVGGHRHISARHVYNAVKEFDDDTRAQIYRMPRNDDQRLIELEPNLQFRELFKNVSRDTLFEFIEQLLARE
jgi:hypothetical protein